MNMKSKIDQLLKRMELAKQGRCQGEADAITHYSYKPGDAECGVCGQPILGSGPCGSCIGEMMRIVSKADNAMYGRLETLEGEALLKEMDEAIPRS